MNDGLQYPANDDRTPWIPRGAGTFNTSTRTYTGSWDAGMAMAFQGFARTWSATAAAAASPPPASFAPAAAAAAGPGTVGSNVTSVYEAAWSAVEGEWNELQQYYFGSQGTHRTQDNHFGGSVNGIGRVLLRRDGFVSLTPSTAASPAPAAAPASAAASSSPASSGPSLEASSVAAGITARVVTAPIRFPAQHLCSGSSTAGGDNTMPRHAGSAGSLVLFVNIAVQQSTGGGVRAGFTHAANGSSILGLDLEASDGIGGDYVRAPLSWRGKSSLAELVGKDVVLTFELKAAHLYAWEWRCV